VEPDEGRAVSLDIAALVNLNHPGHYVHFGWVDISVANLIVIAVMVVVFVLALLLPIPHGGRK
jgi:hypothetical protein